MRGWCRIWGGPTKRTRRRLHGCCDYVRGVSGYALACDWAVTCPLSVSVRRCWSPSISKILMVLSEEHVANRRP